MGANQGYLPPSRAKVKVKVKCIYMGTYQLFPAPVLTQRPVSLFVMKPLPPYPPTPLLTHPLYILRATWFPIYPCCLRYAMTLLMLDSF